MPESERLVSNADAPRLESGANLAGKPLTKAKLRAGVARGNDAISHELSHPLIQVTILLQAVHDEVKHLSTASSFSYLKWWQELKRSHDLLGISRLHLCLVCQSADV